MMIHKKKRLFVLSVSIAFTMLLLNPVKTMAAENSSPSIDNADSSDQNEFEAFPYLNENFYAQQGFTSDLPLAVLYTDGTVTLYEPFEILALDSVTSSSDLLWQQTEATSFEGIPEREKVDYSLTIPESKLQSLSATFWQGTPSLTNQWYLLGNAYDKSLLRNYLAISIASDMGHAVPEMQFCELLLQDETGFRYQGVYLLASPPATSFHTLKRNDTPRDDNQLFVSFAIEENFLVDPLYIQSTDTITKEDMDSIKIGINLAEKSIFAWDYNEFSKYQQYLDERNVYDYFILYELFGNYSAAYTTTYTYDTQRNIFWPTPTLEFEFSLDNTPYDPMDLHKVHMMESPYYASLSKNTNFLKALIDRYQQLYHKFLNSDSINKRIDETVLLLNNAQPRDWARWQHFYDGNEMYWLHDEEAETGSSLPLFDRNSYSYDQEIVKLKYSLSEHGLYMFAGMSTFYDQENMIGDDAPYVKNTWMFLIALFIMIISVRIVRYRTR